MGLVSKLISGGLILNIKLVVRQAVLLDMDNILKLSRYMAERETMHVNCISFIERLKIHYLKY